MIAMRYFNVPARLPDLPHVDANFWLLRFMPETRSKCVNFDDQVGRLKIVTQVSSAFETSILKV
jgi:hypothetical protein